MMMMLPWGTVRTHSHAFTLFSGTPTGIIKSSQVIVSGPNLDNLEKWRELGAATTDINGEVVAKCDIIFICVKPHMLLTCATQIENYIATSVKEKDKIFVSVLAGISLDQLETVSGWAAVCLVAELIFRRVFLVRQAFQFMNSLKMIRTMPNTPMQIGEGCTVYSPGQYYMHHG